MSGVNLELDVGLRSFWNDEIFGEGIEGIEFLWVIPFFFPFYP